MKSVFWKKDLWKYILKLITPHISILQIFHKILIKHLNYFSKSAEKSIEKKVHLK